MTARLIAFLRFAEDQPVNWTALRGAIGADGSLAEVCYPAAGVAYRPPGPSPEESAALYDAVAIVAGSKLPDLPVRLAQIHAYRVESRVMFDRRPDRGHAPAITLVGRLMFHTDMPDSAARRSWTLHAPLAERVHVGAVRYVQNWVVAPLMDDCPPARGIPELGFPDEVALRERFFDSDRGRDEILQDTAHFVAGGPRLYVRSC